MLLPLLARSFLLRLLLLLLAIIELLGMVAWTHVVDSMIALANVDVIAVAVACGEVGAVVDVNCRLPVV
jgi:hypothetical protein